MSSEQLTYSLSIWLMKTMKIVKYLKLNQQQLAITKKTMFLMPKYYNRLTIILIVTNCWFTQFFTLFNQLQLTDRRKN